MRNLTPARHEYNKWYRACRTNVTVWGRMQLFSQYKSAPQFQEAHTSFQHRPYPIGTERLMFKATLHYPHRLNELFPGRK